MKKLLIVPMILLVALVGCSNNTDNGTGTTRTFIGGSDSIDIEFMDETPPAEVYDNGQQPFEVAVRLENLGEYDVSKEDLTLTLSGFYPPDFNNPAVTQNPEEDLQSRFIDSDGEIEQGTITFMNFPGFDFTGNLAGNNEFTFRAQACYKYGTRAQVDLCVLNDLTQVYDKDEDPLCDVNEQKSVQSSSAPVSVENFDQEIAGTRKVKFSFDLVDKGTTTGFISRVGSGCDNSIALEDKVFVDVDTGIDGLTCTGLVGGTDSSGETTLYGGTRKINCIQDVSSVSGDFEKKVNIQVTYDYRDHIEKKVLVKHTTN